MPRPSSIKKTTTKTTTPKIQGGIQTSVKTGNTFNPVPTTPKVSADPRAPAPSTISKSQLDTFISAYKTSNAPVQGSNIKSTVSGGAYQSNSIGNSLSSNIKSTVSGGAYKSAGSNLSSLSQTGIATNSSPTVSSFSNTSYTAPSLGDVSSVSTAPRLPSAPAPTEYNGLNNNYTASVGITDASGTIIPKVAPAAEDPNAKAMQDVIKQLKRDEPEPIDRQAIMEQAGLVQAQKEAQDLSNRINAISAQAQSNILQLRQTAGQEGVTEAVYGGQQAQIERETAIKLMPLTAQYQAAVGNVEAAKEIVNNFIADENKYQDRVMAWKNDIYDKVWSIATTAQKTAIEDRRIKDQNQREDERAFSKEQGDYMKYALENGYGYLTQRIQNATNYADLADVVSGMGASIDTKYKQAQIAEMNTPTSGTNTSSGTVLTDQGKPMNDTQSTAYGYAQRLESADSIIDSVGSQFTGVTSYIGQTLPNILKSEDRQKFEQAKRNFVNAVLRRESGAVISPSEFENAEKQYFPQPGDATAVLTQKNANRQQVIQNLYRSAGVAGQTTSQVVNTPEDLRAKYNY